MDNNSIRVIVADDENLNLEILTKTLSDAKYQVHSFEDGQSTLQYIKSHPDNIDIIILDKIMPHMSGLDVLKHIKNDPIMQHVPVILQTGDVGIEQLKEGLEAGAYYYLSKPFYPEMLLSLVNAAARDCVKRNQVLKQLAKEKPATIFMKAGVFELKTIEDAFKLAAALAYHSTRQNEVNIGLSELLINAIEHGNLGIGYDEKNHLLQAGKLTDEITRRAILPENINKIVKIIFEKDNKHAYVTIEDQGPGFEWKKYMSFDPLRLTDLNGRGIASANVMGLGLTYLGTGNKVKCQFDLIGQ